MTRRSAILLVVVVALTGASRPRAAAAATPAQVEASIAKAREFLYKTQAKDGTWETSPKRLEIKKGEPDWKGAQAITGGQWGGQTALAVFALLVAGDSPQDPRLVRAVDFLMKADLIGTYALGIRAQVLQMLPPTPQTRTVMKRDLQKLLGMMKTQGKARGFYDYVPQGKSYSLSRAQYGVLGVWAAALAGEEVPSRYWSEVERAWVAAQEADGGWRYKPGDASPPVTAGITAVGIATLFIVSDQLYGNRGIDCRNPTEVPAIEKGIDWMAKNFDKVASETKYPRDFPNPTLYAVERVGVAGGLKYFGPHDWYKKGAEYLVKRQRKDGAWTGGLSTHSDTCFGVVFLSRGRAPVIINKLDWVADAKEGGGAWNRRPRDVANVTRWIGRSIERDFNWQVMSLDAPMADWHDAPIMYLAGSDPMKIGREHVEKLRRYAEEGGLILVHADCGKGGFVGTAKKLAAELFPTYEFRELSESHPIYTTLYPRSKWKNKPSVLGVSNGVREMLLLIPQADPGKTWQIGVTRNREEPWQLAANLVFYAADQKDLKFKGETHIIPDDPNAKTNASLKVARLRYKGNWDPEPGGWRRLRNLLRRDDKLDANIEPVDLGSGSLEGVKLAHLTGTTRLKLDDAAKDQLKKFIADGGTLVIDAAGGSEAFASSLQDELVTLGTGANLDLLPPDHSLFGGKDGMKVAYRPFARRALTGSMNVPRLKAVRVGDRPAILFSREDLSSGLLGTSTGGIVGYQADTATQIMRRIVLRAANVASPPSAATRPVAQSGGKSSGKSGSKSSKPKPKTDAPKPPAKDDNSGFD